MPPSACQPRPGPEQGKCTAAGGAVRPMGYHLHVDSDPIHVGQTIVGEPLGRIAIRHDRKVPKPASGITGGDDGIAHQA